MPPPVSSTRVGPIATPRVERSPEAKPTATVEQVKSTQGWLATGAAKPRPQTAVAAGTSTPAPAPATQKEIGPTEQRDLSTFEGRRRLATEASQVNPISADPKIDNADRICAGAAAVNALILNSTTPAAAKANAQALRSAMGAADVKLPPSLDKKAIDTALSHLEANTPSMNDVFVLQQVAYGVGRRFAEKTDKDDGLNPAQLAGLVADLKGRGANFDSNTQFSLSKQHWVAHVGSTTANSDTNVSIDSGAKLPSNKAWSGDVVIRPDGVVEARARTVRVDGQDLNAADYAKRFELAQPKKDGLTRGWTFPITPVDPNKSTGGAFLSLGDHRKQLTTGWINAVTGSAPPVVLK